MSNLMFRGMALMLRLMERFRKPGERLERVGLAPGQTVLEYGCGAGSFTEPAARMLGREGYLYVADIHPLALETVQKRLDRAGLANVETILTERETGLPDGSVDAVLLYDTLHLVGDKQALLQELHRVLKPEGFLSADHQHTDREAFLETVTGTGFFAVRDAWDGVYNFARL
jgi:ubiquinone/menaquinone biosynthesis C-methylase UbiE